MASKESQLDRINSGFASTSKKQRLAVQAIATHIANTEKDPEKALKWLEVQKGLLENQVTINERWKEHDERFGAEDEDEKPTPGLLTSRSTAQVPSPLVSTVTDKK